LSNESLSALWQARLSERKSSGLSVKSWCSANEIPEHRFYYWQRKLSECSSASSELPAVDWLTLGISERIANSFCISIRVGSATIDVKSGFDASLLSAVVSALSDGRC